MGSGYVAVLDSGIGGFSCLIEAARLLPCERFLYFGDNKNAPYGSRKKGELYYLTRKNLSFILRYNVKAVIIGCNTLSMTVLPIIQPAVNVPLFGVYPPVDIKRGKAFLFATPPTCAKIRESGNLKIFPLEKLAADIEGHKGCLESVDLSAHLAAAKVPMEKADTLILGCTHYFFVKNQFIDHFCPRKVLSGEKNSALRLKKYLADSGIMGNNKEFTVDFIGENAEENYIFYNSVVKNIIFNAKNYKKI